MDKDKLTADIIEVCKEATKNELTPESLANVADALALSYAAHIASMYNLGMFDINVVREMCDANKSLALNLCLEGEK